jgi:hypothetical protein
VAFLFPVRQPSLVSGALYFKNCAAREATLALRGEATVLYNGREGFNFNFICFLPEVELLSLLLTVRLFFGNKKIIVLQATVEKFQEIEMNEQKKRRGCTLLSSPLVGFLIKGCSLPPSLDSQILTYFCFTSWPSCNQGLI